MVATELAAENKVDFSKLPPLPRSLDSRIPLPTKEPVIPSSEIKPTPEDIQKARETLCNSPYAETHFTPFFDIPGALYVVTAINNPTLGLYNPYGQTLGGTRVVEIAELQKEYGSGNLS